MAISTVGAGTLLTPPYLSSVDGDNFVKSVEYYIWHMLSNMIWLRFWLPTTSVFLRTEQIINQNWYYLQEYQYFQFQ